MEILRRDLEGRINVIGVIGFAINAIVAGICASGFITGAFVLASDPLRADVDHRLYAAVGLSLVVLVGLAGWRGKRRAEVLGRELNGSVGLYCITVALRGFRWTSLGVVWWVIAVAAFFVSVAERGLHPGQPPLVIGGPETSFLASALFAILIVVIMCLAWKLLSAAEGIALRYLKAKSVAKIAGAQ